MKHFKIKANMVKNLSNTQLGTKFYVLVNNLHLNNDFASEKERNKVIPNSLIVSLIKEPYHDELCSGKVISDLGDNNNDRLEQDVYGAIMEKLHCPIKKDFNIVKIANKISKLEKKELDLSL